MDPAQLESCPQNQTSTDITNMLQQLLVGSKYCNFQLLSFSNGKILETFKSFEQLIAAALGPPWRPPWRWSQPNASSCSSCRRTCSCCAWNWKRRNGAEKLRRTEVETVGRHLRAGELDSNLEKPMFPPRRSCGKLLLTSPESCHRCRCGCKQWLESNILDLTF